MKDDSELHPFLRQKGYQAIVGDARLSVPEIEYLLTLQDSASALKRYAFGKQYLELLTTASGTQIGFKSRYITLWSRRWRKIVYYLMYVAFYLLACSPILAPSFKSQEGVQTASTLALTALFFLPLAILSLRAGVRIARAESLVKAQHKHVQPIVSA